MVVEEYGLSSTPKSPALAALSTFAAFILCGLVPFNFFTGALLSGVPAMAGQLASTYFIPVIYVPLLMITHILALYWLARPQPKSSSALIGAQPQPGSI